MAKSDTVRNFRDGQLQIKDGSSTPISSVVLIDEGDVSWTESENPQITRCRGTIIGVRPGDDEPMELSYTVKWTQLIQGSTDASDGHVLYEMIDNIGDTYTSTTAGHYTLDHVLTVADPADVAACDEVITFEDVFKVSLNCQEGDEYNTIEFTGQSINIAPTIVRA